MKKDKAIFILLVLANTAVLTFESDNADILFFLAFLNLLVCVFNFGDLFKLKEERGIIVAMLDEAVSQAKIYKDRNPLQSEIDELHKARKDLSKEAQKINELNR